MSGDKLAKDFKQSRFVYSNALLENKPEPQGNLFLTPDYSPASDSGQGKIFGNSARFYKALKDYQQYSDPNILKEELWASRKEITNLEKLLLEKTEEILELKKSGSEQPKSDQLKKSLENEKNNRKILELENIKLQNRLNVQTNDGQGLAKLKNLFEFHLKKVQFDYEDKLGRILNKVKENELRLKGVKNFSLNLKLAVSEKNEYLLQEKKREILDLKKEIGKFNRVLEKKTLENEEKNKTLSGKIEEFRERNEKLLDKVKACGTEAKLLNEINQELERENLLALKTADEQKSRVKELIKKLEKFKVRTKDSKGKLADSQRCYEKYKKYKKKYKGSLKAGDESLAVEVERLNGVARAKDNVILELKDDIAKKESIIEKLREEIDNMQITNKGVSLEKYERVLNDFKNLNEEYERLLRSYSDSQENNENDLKLRALCAEYEERIVDLESDLAICESKVNKYKEILSENSLLPLQSQNLSGIEFLNNSDL